MIIISYFKDANPISARIARAGFKAGGNRGVSKSMQGTTPKGKVRQFHRECQQAVRRRCQKSGQVVDTLETELIFACMHRRQKEYVVEPKLTTLRAVIDRFKLWYSHQTPEVRAIGESTF